MKLTQKNIYSCLKQVIDPELGIDIVALGLIYKVEVFPDEKIKVVITMTLTSPGCPLAGAFDGMVRDSLFDIENLDRNKEVEVILTFDPPWLPDMMDEEAKAELGFE
jgi:metal-sulfur cluster biosynthetic enzyme